MNVWKYKAGKRKAYGKLRRGEVVKNSIRKKENRVNKEWPRKTKTGQNLVTLHGVVSQKKKLGR